MRGDRSALYNSPSDFFDLGGNCVMTLSPRAAIGVCEKLSEQNVPVGRIEGGLWSEAGFEARLDCIWDSPDSLSGADFAEINNKAAEFIAAELGKHNAFIITATFASGDETNAA